jgi:hypothetical protein
MVVHDHELEHGYQTFITGMSGSGKVSLMNWLFIVASLNKTPLSIVDRDEHRMSLFHNNEACHLRGNSTFQEDRVKAIYEDSYWDDLPIHMVNPTANYAYSYRRIPVYSVGSVFVDYQDSMFINDGCHRDTYDPKACHFVRMPELQHGQREAWLRLRGTTGGIRDITYLEGRTFLGRWENTPIASLTEHGSRRLNALMSAADADEVDLWDAYMSHDCIAADLRFPADKHPTLAKIIERDAQDMTSRVFALSRDVSALGETILSQSQSGMNVDNGDIHTAIASLSSQQQTLTEYCSSAYNQPISSSLCLALIPCHPSALHYEVSLSDFGYGVRVAKDQSHNLCAKRKKTSASSTNVSSPPSTAPVNTDLLRSSVSASMSALNTIRPVLRDMVAHQSAGIDVAISHADSDTMLQEMRHIAEQAGFTTPTPEFVRKFSAHPCQFPQYSEVILSLPTSYPSLSSLLQLIGAYDAAKMAVATAIDLSEVAEALHEDLTVCPDIGCVINAKELLLRRMQRFYRNSNMFYNIDIDVERFIMQESRRGRYESGGYTSCIINMITVDDTIATTQEGNVDAAFTSDFVSLCYALKRMKRCAMYKSDAHLLTSLATDDFLETQLLESCHRMMFTPQSFRWSGYLGMIANALDVLNRYSLLDIRPMLFQSYGSYNHSSAILGGRYFPPVAIDTLDCTFYGSQEVQLAACLSATASHIHRNSADLVNRRGPTFIRFPRDIPCFDGCCVLPPAALDAPDAAFKVVLSLRVESDAAEALPHDTPSHEGAISSLRTTLAAAHEQENIRVDVVGAYHLHRYASYSEDTDTDPPGASVSCDIVSVPVDMISMSKRSEHIIQRCTEVLLI